MPDEDLQIAAGSLSPGLTRSAPPRTRRATTHDVVQIVQACMAPGTQTPAD